MLKLWVLEAQPSSLASHIHRMVKDEDNHLENKGSRVFFFLFFFGWPLGLVAGLFGTSSVCHSATNLRLYLVTNAERA